MTPITTPSRPRTRHEFEAMGVTVELLLDPDFAVPGTIFEEVATELRRLEQIFSRFLPGSELSALNRAGALDVGPELFAVVQLAVSARERSGGRFDPTVHVRGPRWRRAQPAGAACSSTRDGAASSSRTASGSTSGASRRGGQSTVPASCSRARALASSTQAATSRWQGCSAAARGP
jgi:hypothetical protein